MDYYIKVSSDGNVHLPKHLMKECGIEPGSDLVITQKNHQLIIKTPKKHSIEEFFAMGKGHKVSFPEVKEAIKKAVDKNDKY